MKCCGVPDKKLRDAENRPTARAPQHGSGTINRQPAPQPPPRDTPEPFLPPGITRPNTAHQPTHNGHNPNPVPQVYQSVAATGDERLSNTPPPPTSANTYDSSAVSSSTSGSSPIPRPGQAHHPHPTQSLLSHSEPNLAGTAESAKISVAIDFGTTFSGVAYGSSRITSGKVQQILHWPGSLETFRKVPTCLLYDEHGRVLAWGLEAKNSSPVPGTTLCEWFKLFLEPQALRDEGSIDPRLPQLPTGKKALDLIIDYLSCLWEYAKEEITRETGAVADLTTADVWLTVPAAWDAKGGDMMREAAITAGLVQSSRAGDRDWRERLRIITEPEAAAVHCAHLTDLHKLKPSQNFMICDAGGGTVDLAVYKIIGQMANLEIAEMCARSGANCGSIYLDLRFRDLVEALLVDHPAHLDNASLAYFMHSFSETEKLAFDGPSDDDTMFHFTCFNVEDPHDPSVGLNNGQLSIPGNLLRRRVFDPVVAQVLELIEEQSRKTDERIDALLLVGGFSGSDYLFRRVQEQFAARIKVIERPPDADTATARGAAQYGLARRPLVSSVIAPRSYFLRVKLPAEPEDMMKRPAYIKMNDAGFSICENRLQYLVQKGAILRKGQRVTTKFCKFSQNSQDSTFVAILFTSDTDKIMRYSDESEMVELCKWTVNLGSLPAFRRNASLPQANGFYTEFELGLELDSAEVRGILLHEGQEWGRVVFDFLN